MELKKSSSKYEDMEAKTDRKIFDVKKMAEKTQRALHVVHQPKDEKLIEDDLLGLNRSSNIVENGGFNDGFGTLPQLENQSRKDTSKTNTGQSIRTHKSVHGNPVKRSSTQTDSRQISIDNMIVLPQSSYNGEFIVRDKRNQPYTHPFQTYSENFIDGNLQPFRTSNNDSLIRVDTRKMPKKGDVISFHKIIYKVTTKKYLWSKPVKKIVLDNVSGIMLPGVNAIMGPTGSGKSSILDVLAGRKNPKFLDGKVLINGHPQPKNFKCMSGYVVQDDIVMGTLTVQENLMFSAALRLPEGLTKAERLEKIDKIIDELGLTAVANSKIGTELIRGVSGGERKRCNIGMELITDPVVLFLDEPTTGLDAFTAASVIQILQKLSRKGKTIILSIHQPKYSIYKLFDRYTLMANGKIIYHGKAGSSPIRYFENLGYYIEDHNNPSDFYMDIIHGEVTNDKEVVDQQKALLSLLCCIDQSETKKIRCSLRREYGYSESLLKGSSLARNSRTRKLESSGEYSDMRTLGRRPTDANAKIRIIDRLTEDWLESSNNKELERQLSNYDSIAEDPLLTEVKCHIPAINYSTGWCNQLKWVSWRTGLNLLRNPQTSIILMAVYLFFALSMGTVYFGLTKSFNRGYQDRYGLFFFSALQVVFVNLGAIEIFIKERPIFIHENSSGYYRVSSYFFAKLICDMVPIKVFPAIVFLPITYFMSGLKLKAGAFFFFELILLLTTAAGCSIAFFVSSSFSVFGLANVVTPIIYVFMMVFSGFFISIESIFAALNWCRYLSAFRYALAGLAVNELEGTQFCQNTSVACMSGNDFLTQNSIPYSTDWDLWLNVLGLILITLFFLTLCYVQLRRINKYK